MELLFNTVHSNPVKFNKVNHDLVTAATLYQLRVSNRILSCSCPTDTIGAVFTMFSPQAGPPCRGSRRCAWRWCALRTRAGTSAVS